MLATANVDIQGTLKCEHTERRDSHDFQSKRFFYKNFFSNYKSTSLYPLPAQHVTCNLLIIETPSQVENQFLYNVFYIEIKC